MKSCSARKSQLSLKCNILRLYLQRYLKSCRCRKLRLSLQCKNPITAYMSSRYCQVIDGHITSTLNQETPAAFRAAASRSESNGEAVPVNRQPVTPIWSPQNSSGSERNVVHKIHRVAGHLTCAIKSASVVTSTPTLWPS